MEEQGRSTLLAAEEFPAREQICVYHERWEEEIVFDEQKLFSYSAMPIAGM